MVPRRVVRPLLVALLNLLALAPSAGQPLPASAATLAFMVTSTADSHDANPGDGVCADAASQCSLRAAVEEANAQPAGSVITITIPAGTYLLALGQLTLTTNTITLAGARARQTVIDGRGHRVLAVDAFARIDGVTLRNGNAGTSAGGALANAGVAILSRSAIVSDTAKSGGGIYNAPSARFWLLRSSVVSNTAPSGSGGGIVNQGTLMVSGSSLSENTALVGGAIASTGTLTLTTSTVSTITATLPCCSYDGGGIYTSGTTTVISSTLSGNSAPSGGGISNDANGTLTVSQSTLSNNYGDTQGGGIVSAGALTVTNSTLSGNSAPYAGGIASFVQTLSVMSSTFSGNSADVYGGGIANYSGGTLTVTNSTFSDNSAEKGGGIFNDVAGTLTMIYSTVTGNSTGIYNSFVFGGVTATAAFTGSIVANSTSGPNCLGLTFKSQGHNLDSGASCGFTQTTDLTNTDPLLGPLADNGGPTQTMALLPGSPAIDHGGTSANGCPATDQRSVTRPQGPACDIGAFEANEAAPSTGFLDVCKNVNGPISASTTFTFAVDDGSYHTTVNLSLPASATGASVCTPLPVFNGIPAGQATITEQTLPGWALASVDVFPQANQVSTDLTMGTAVVTIVGTTSSQTQTDVVFTNAPTSPATAGLATMAR